MEKEIRIPVDLGALLSVPEKDGRDVLTSIPYDGGWKINLSTLSEEDCSFEVEVINDQISKGQAISVSIGSFNQALRFYETSAARLFEDFDFDSLKQDGKPPTSMLIRLLSEEEEEPYYDIAKTRFSNAPNLEKGYVQGLFCDIERYVSEALDHHRFRICTKTNANDLISRLIETDLKEIEGIIDAMGEHAHFSYTLTMPANQEGYLYEIDHELIEMSPELAQALMKFSLDGVSRVESIKSLTYASVISAIETKEKTDQR